MKITYIRSFEEYCKYIENYKNQAYFRGQADSAWPIVPSLFRVANSSTIDDERKQIDKEKSESRLDTLPTLFKLQHYGTPTRICDLTISPLSALFFATFDDKHVASDGAVYVIKKDHEIILNSKEAHFFSKVLEGDTTIPDNDIKTDFEQSIQRNYIIRYGFDFSYTNNRAIRQGGTGLLFGFSYEDGTIKTMTKQGVESYIIEKIVIPAAYKKAIVNHLKELGYAECILYDSMENTGDGRGVEFYSETPDIQNKATFTKYVSKYRFSNLYFNRDEFVEKIAQLYKELFGQFGSNSRIWLYFYFDDNDVVHSNWLCRTVWSEGIPYRILWTKDYYTNRMVYINEQAGRKEVCEKLSKLLVEILPIYDDIVASISDSCECLPDVLKKVIKYEGEISRIVTLARNVPFGDAECEKVAKLALGYIECIDLLMGDMIIFNKRGECTTDDKTIYYLLKKSYMKKCEESKKQLDLFYKFIEGI